MESRAFEVSGLIFLWASDFTTRGSGSHQSRALRKLFKNPDSQAELNKIVPFGFSLQRQKNGVFLPLK